MYAYQNGQLVNTFLVTAGAPATPTPIGQFKIFAKYPVQNMTGYNTNGTTYYQPNVQWVNYFYQADAVHGNYWRPLSYFGNINSSHGCVGVVNSDAEWIYNWAPIGTTVIVHL
jgi:lipoprotein-anchoring transpeptidase ErfK/SrfK